MFLDWVRARLFLAICMATYTPAHAEGRWYYSGYLGVMTENRWHEVITPGELDLADSGLVGGSVGWDRQIGASRFSYGFEVQALKHFGRQDHFEFNLPLVLRYTPRKPFPRQLNSVSFGIGLSHATEIPQVEVDRKGVSQRNFVYWMADVEFSLPRPETSVFFRLHHRSDGYGIYDVSSGSTGLVLGLRRSF